MKKPLIIEFIREERGASAIEYSLIAGIVSMGIVFALTQISSSLQSSLFAVSAMFSSASN
jgi:Flp pilus assembly pilin Flp